MAFLDSLTDVFTGAPAKKAAEQQRQFLDTTRTAGMADIGTGLNRASNYVTSGAGAARGALGTGYGQSREAVGSGATDALGYIDAGTEDAMGRYGAAREAYDPLTALSRKYGGATDLALGALGVNGADGTAAARGAFTAGPAYDFNLEQGLEAINRRRNMGGMLNSGNADRDAQEFGAGLASNEYDKWLNNLLGFTNPELSATSGAASGLAGVAGDEAALAAGAGTARAGIASDRGRMMADLASRYGGDVAGLERDTGNTLAGLETGAAGQRVALGTNLAQPYAQTYGQEAAAQQQGSGNLWNLVGNLGTAGAKIAGRAAGGFADGGRPPVGQPSVVGERGPEMFVPDRPGTIVPNEVLAREALRDRDAAAREWRDPVARFMRQFLGPSAAY